MVALHGNLDKRNLNDQIVFIKDGRNLHSISLWTNESFKTKLSR